MNSVSYTLARSFSASSSVRYSQTVTGQLVLRERIQSTDVEAYESALTTVVRKQFSGKICSFLLQLNTFEVRLWSSTVCLQTKECLSLLKIFRFTVLSVHHIKRVLQGQYSKKTSSAVVSFFPYCPDFVLCIII